MVMYRPYGAEHSYFQAFLPQAEPIKEKLAGGQALLPNLKRTSKCIHGDSRLGSVIERFCFFMGTFTVVKHHNKSVSNREVAHPGVGPYVKTDGEEIIRHIYYQWVIFVLFIQAIFFYVPHLIWREMEQGKLKYLIKGINEMKMLKEEVKRTSFNQVEFQLKNRIYINRSWSISLIFCEFLNLANLILQIYLTNVFLGYQFWDLGKKVYWDKRGDEFNPLDVVFPKVTKCSFQKFGPSGSIQFHDIMCVMALNIVNEKLYIVLWFWYVILFVLSVSILLWRFLSFFLKNSLPFNKYVFNFTAMSALNEDHLRRVLHNVSFGEWMFLRYLASNMSSKLFSDLLAQMSESYYEEEEEKPLEKKPLDVREEKPLEKKPLDVWEEKPLEKKPLDVWEEKPLEKKPLDVREEKPLEKKPLDETKETPKVELLLDI